MKKILFICLVFATTCFAQLPVGTQRNPIYTDVSGNVLNTPVTLSNQWIVVPTPSNAFNIVRLVDLTNSSAVYPIPIKKGGTGTNTTLLVGAWTNTGNFTSTTFNGLTSTTFLTNFTTPIPWLTLTGQGSNVMTVNTNSTKIALNTFSDNNGGGITNMPVSGLVGSTTNFVLTANGTGLAPTWNAASSGGGGDVFTASNNTFIAGKPQTINGSLVSSNSTFNGPSVLFVAGNAFTNNGSSVFSNTTFNGPSVLYSQGVMVTNLGSSFVSNLTVFSGAIISTNTAPSTNFLGYAIFGANQTSATNRIISFIDPTNNNAFVGHIRRNGDGLDINANAVNFKMNTAGYTMAGTSVLMNGGSLQVSVGSITIAGTGAANGNLTVGRTATISSNLVCNGVFSLGTNGTLHTALYSATAVLDFTNSLVLGTSQTNKINITGVHPNDAVIMGPPVDLSSVTDSFFRAYIAESNVVTVLRTAFTATTVYTNKTWRATVLSP